MDTQDNKENIEELDNNETLKTPNFIRAIISRQPFRKQYKIKNIEITFQEITTQDSFKAAQQVQKYESEHALLSIEERNAIHLYYKLPYALYKVFWNGDMVITPQTKIENKREFINNISESIYSLLLKYYTNFNLIHMKLMAESTNPNFFLKQI